MKILIDMGHPAHVHLFKNFIWEMEKHGHEIKVTARDKEVTRQLLDGYGIPYETVGKPSGGIFALGREWIQRTMRIATIGRRHGADIYIGVLNPATAFSAWINRKWSITFSDTEHAELAKKVTFPFTYRILTPSCYTENIGKKQTRYNGYHELAYLHPTRFTPDPAVLSEVGLAEGDRFIVIRFVSWGSSHDVGQHGIADKAGLVTALSAYGRVLITSEGALPDELQPYRIRLPPEKVHDLLYYASLYVGEGATMATEAALLGTPSIYISSLARLMGNFIELEKTYGLLSSFSDTTAALGKAEEILTDPHSKENWKLKKERLLNDKIDVTAFMVRSVEDCVSGIRNRT
ncbi:MAG TPA: DUF354 domain-containing protein [Methanoregulaceae archaeon]|nr:DUF354 domain-containing protein [Methanoregulaceae archaeon]HPD76535.1 DUF354 domain-containing protein [Methanoregulaceae archaeon]